MIKIITSILLLLGSANLIAQINYTAIITDPQIGIDANAEKLIEVVDDINKRDSISLIVVMGNITANGKFDEFLWAQEILDGLTVPYFVVGGEKDYYLSEGKGNEISLLWGDDKFWFEQDNEIHIGFNDFVPKYINKNHISVETKNWIKNNFNSSPQQNPRIFYYTFSNMLGPLYWYGTIPKGLQQLSIIKNPMKKVISPKSFAPQSLAEESVWIYNLIDSRKDSLFIYDVVKTDSMPSVVFSLAQNELTKTGGAGAPPFYIYPFEKIMLKIHLESSIFAEPILEFDNNYIGTKKGSIICLDQSGNEKWRYKTHGSIYSSPKVEKDLVVVATNEGDLFTINKNTGNLFQVIGIGETITSDIELVDIEYNGMQTKGICFGTAEGNLYCYELYSLELIWWNQIAKNWINSSVSTIEGKVIFQDKKGTLYCLSSQTGVLLWKWKANTKKINPLFKSDIIVKNNSIYFVDFDGDLHCIDALLGTKKWSKRKIEATGKIELDDKKNEIVLHSAKNKIKVVSLDKRKVTEEFILPGTTKEEIATDILLADNIIYASFTDGSVLEIRENFRIIFGGNAPIVSINEINGNILVTDYDGNLTLLDISKEKK